MTNEEWNGEVYQRMAEEQEAFRQWLLSQKPEVVLDHCYEYAVREDIVMAMEEHDLSDRQCKALLRSRTPLADVFKTWQTWETGHMDDIRACLESRADDMIRRGAPGRQKEGR